MDNLILLFILFLLLLVLLPLIVLGKIQSLNREIKELTKSIKGLEKKLDHTLSGDTSSQTEIKVKTEVSSVIEKKIIKEKTLEVTIPTTEVKIQSATSQKEKAVTPQPVVKTKVTKQEKRISKSFIENISGENLLSKIGIITLVLGIAFFVKYAIDKEWINEIGRVGIGLLTGCIIIGVGHKLRKQYDVFASILAGGGIAVFYITVTLAFREYELLSQTIAFLVLIVITVFSVILSLLYNKKELAIFSLLGGFASPFMISTGSGNYIVLFSYIFILNTGMLVISFLRNWRIVGILSYFLTLIVVWSWLFTSYKNQYWGATTYLTLFFIQFYLLVIIDHLKRGKHIHPNQALLIITNNLSFFLGCLYVFNDYPGDIRGLITICIAAINTVIMLTLFRNITIDRKFIYLLIAIILSFVSLAVPIQLEGHAITMFWATEMIVLLWLWQTSQIKIFRAAFLILTALVVTSYAMDIEKGYYELTQPVRFLVNRHFITGIVIIAAFLISSWMIKKEIIINGNSETPQSIWNPRFIKKIFLYIITILIFLVPYLEFNYQLQFFDISYSHSFRELCMATYTLLYIAILTIIYRKQNSIHPFFYYSLLFFASMIVFYYNQLAIDLREDIYLDNIYHSRYFLIHLLSIPAYVCIIGWLGKNTKLFSAKKQQIFTWGLTLLTILFITFETDHISIMLFYKTGDYSKILYDVHTFVYPIIWGILAMVLMIWGLKKKLLILRKISLIFFAFIIGKFYIYDVWHMSQTGRIISFVMLGVILLLVSFMQQKIKTLVKKEKVPEEINNYLE